MLQADSFRHEHIIADHLGITRVMFTADGDSALVLQENAYDAFGLEIASLGYTGTPGQGHEYLYNGKERQRFNDLGWDQFKWRMHDPALARFISIDPLAEDYTHNSTYAFSENSTVAFVELEGLEKEYYLTRKYYTLNKAERGSGNYFFISQAIDNRVKAEQVTASRFGNNGHNDQSDAFRHAYFNAMNTVDTDEETTREMGIAHENGDNADEVIGAIDEVRMDLHNNEIGIEIGLNNPDATDEELADLTFEALQSGKLVYLEKIELEGYTFNILSPTGDGTSTMPELKGQDHATKILNDKLNEKSEEQNNP